MTQSVAPPDNRPRPAPLSPALSLSRFDLSAAFAAARTPLGVSAILFVLTVLVYARSYQGEGAHFNYHVRLADAFAHGRLYLTEMPPWLNELVVAPDGPADRFYVVHPPMPAVLLTPFVFVFGPDVPQAALSVALGAANVALAHLVFVKLFHNRAVAFWTAVLYGFGTIQWYHAEVGSAWYIAHIVGLFFLWLALLESLTRRRFLIVGLCIGAAYMARLPTIFAFLFFVVFFHDQFFRIARAGKDWAVSLFIAPTAKLVLGVSVPVVLNGLYNWARFGTFLNAGYELIPDIWDEPWYRYGLLDVRYIPTHLDEMLTHLPTFRSEWPYAVPSVFAMAVWVTTPAFLMIPFARYRTLLAQAAVIAAVAIALPIVMHGGNGFTQFGFRHTLDFMPFLLILTASAMRDRVRWWMIALIALSIAINFWGVLMLSVYDIWTW
jgi:hypothetical protein